MQDREEGAEEARDRIEYMARFIDNKAVNEVRRMREIATRTDDDQFETLLRQQFGKGLGSPLMQEKTLKQLGAEIDRANR